MTHCVTNATPIQFIDGNKLESCGMGSTNHTRPISYHIMPLVINAFGGRHTDTHIHKHTYQCTNKNDFKKPGKHSLQLHVLRLKPLQCGIKPRTSCITYNMFITHQSIMLVAVWWAV